MFQNVGCIPEMGLDKKQGHNLWFDQILEDKGLSNQELEVIYIVTLGRHVLMWTLKTLFRASLIEVRLSEMKYSISSNKYDT